jgi:hypothetical protein
LRVTISTLCNGEQILSNSRSVYVFPLIGQRASLSHTTMARSAETHITSASECVREPYTQLFLLIPQSRASNRGRFLALVQMKSLICWRIFRLAAPQLACLRVPGTFLLARADPISTRRLG